MPIHIIDDEVVITEVLSEALRSFSDQIKVFYNAEAYLSHMRSAGYIQPRLIITDVVMGGIDGLALIKLIRASDSKAKIIVMSGFHNHPKIEQESFDGMLAKPFDFKHLCSMVSQLLSSNVSEKAKSTLAFKE